jgi:hypothetical protein
MLYAVLGALMEKAAAVLRSDALAAGGEHADVQRRRVAAFVGRVGRMWPGLGAALFRQNVVLGMAITEARSAIRRHGETPDDESAAAAHPLAVHQAHLGELDRLVVGLHERGAQEWAVEARRALRRRLAEAARIEMALVAGTPTQ